MARTARQNILILSAGRRVSLVRSFRAELNALIPGAAVFAADALPELSAACRIADRSFSLPKAGTPEYISALQEICRDQEIGLVVPTIDTELLPLAAERERFAAEGTTLLVSELKLVSACRDKRATITLFESYGIASPQLIDKQAPRFPLFVKPVDGSSSKEAALITEPRQLERKHLEDDRLLFFEAIDRELFDEYTCDLYFNRAAQLCCCVPRKRIEVRAGEVSKGITIRNEVVSYLTERLSRWPGAVGCITLQLFKHREAPEFYGIEVNPRFGGGYPLSYRAGANYPGWCIREHLFGEEIRPFDGWEENLLMLRYDDEVFVHGAHA